MINEKDYEIAFQMIVIAGDSKSDAMESIRAARQGNLAKARELLDSADKKMIEVHKLQNGMIQEEARGNAVEVNIILVHALDHITMAVMARDLAAELVEMATMLQQLKPCA